MNTLDWLPDQQQDPDTTIWVREKVEIILIASLISVTWFLVWLDLAFHPTQNRWRNPLM